MFIHMGTCASRCSLPCCKPYTVFLSFLRRGPSSAIAAKNSTVAAEPCLVICSLPFGCNVDHGTDSSRARSRGSPEYFKSFLCWTSNSLLPSLRRSP
ncbi:uncharacterized protein M421DRAFT_354131 [Didymella exigua CBS 183.55]|uniref:Uncharacterized protein n=1 Tax=Didymella exigua CBS 183.55 TaxID=1150837 RepID=A0A6A5R9P8_9PLEO|nr:uncharacterized protein M421DRAFT_354131 [Didymella exigua CBS 183.55]KAF1922557.1 hypothetical protein M421DRAFT_354131 [Didymella exigua CBS 183.55]